MESEKYVTLFSNTCQALYNTNRYSKFRNKFIVPLKLEGEWKVSLLDISFPFNPFNVAEQKIGFLIRTGHLANNIVINDTSGIEVDEDQYFESATSPVDSVSSEGTQLRILGKYRSGLLPGGFYSSVGELAFEIVKLFNTLFADEKERKQLHVKLCMDYDQSTNQVKVYLNNLEDGSTKNDEEETNDEDESKELDKTTIKILMESSGLLEGILGFDNVNQEDSKYGTEFCLEVSQQEQVSANPCRLQQFYKIYICTDLIDYQIVGNNSLRLLATCAVPLTGNYHMICPSPRFHSIVSGYESVRNVDSIEIELFSNIQTLEYFPGPLNPSEYDFVECTLHFKRSSLISSFPI